MRGRPSKTTVDYFPHRTSHKKTIFTLESLYGNDGYAFWFKLLEILGSTEGHVFRYEKTADWLFLVAKTGVSEEKATLILKTLADLDAIDNELHKEKVIWSDKFVDGLLPVYDKRSTEIPVKPTLRGEKAISVEKNTQSKVKESREEKSREDKKTKRITFDKPDFIPDELWWPLLENRKYKKLQNTNLALKTFTKAIKAGIDAGYTAEECIGHYVSTNWSRFNHEWMKTNNVKQTRQNNIDNISQVRKVVENGTGFNPYRKVEERDSGGDADKDSRTLPQ